MICTELHAEKKEIIALKCSCNQKNPLFPAVQISVVYFQYTLK